MELKIIDKAVITIYLVLYVLALLFLIIVGLLK